jgi:GMP synthase (glutamine-hydrolysing)
MDRERQRRTGGPEVIVLQNAAAEGPGLVADALASMGARLRLVRADLGAPVPRSPEGAAGVVVMGGPMGVPERDRHPHLRDALRLLEAALRSELPVLGICLGSQLLAAALGARVAPSGSREIGWLEVERLAGAEGDPLLGATPQRFTPLHWHGDVFDLPAGAVSLARSTRTESQAFRYGELAWGILFHLEANEAQVQAMLRAFGDEVREAGVAPETIAAAAPERLASLRPIAERTFATFAARVRGGAPAAR